MTAGSSSLVPLAEIQEREQRGKVGITAVTRLKHAELFAAAKKFKHGKNSQYGGQSAMAKKLRVTPMELGRWINLQDCPPTEPTKAWSAKRILRLEATLLAITGKTMEELFPKSLRDNIKFLKSPKVFERTVHVEQKALEHYALATRERMLLEQQPVQTDREELALQIKKILQTLPARDQFVLELRYGLNDQPAHTLEEAAKICHITRERVRQIEMRAVRRLQQYARNEKLHEIIDVEFD